MSDAILGTFILADEIERFTPGPSEAGRRAETLVKTDRLRVVLVTMRTGARLHDHTAPGPITIQALRGRFDVTIGDGTSDVSAGSLVAIEANVVHAVQAVEDGAFLLTISWPPQQGDTSHPLIDR